MKELNTKRIQSIQAGGIISSTFLVALGAGIPLRYLYNHRENNYEVLDKLFSSYDNLYMQSTNQLKRLQNYFQPKAPSDKP